MSRNHGSCTVCLDGDFSHLKYDIQATRSLVVPDGFFEVQGRNMHMKLNICDYVGLCLANEKVFAGFLQWRCHERVYLHKCIMLIKIRIKVSNFIAGYS